MEVTFYGVRGSTPSPGAAFLRYGGHTSCVGIARDGEPPCLFLDAGTGLATADEVFGERPFVGSILLGHLHWDHTHGLPFFLGGRSPEAEVSVMLPAQGGGTTAADVIGRAMSPPHFPIGPGDLGPGWGFSFVEEGEIEVEGFKVLLRDIPHPGGRAFGIRVSDGAGSLAYVSDHSPTSLGPGPDGFGVRHDSALELAEGVDLLIHDAQNTPDEFPELEFLGHSIADYPVGLAEEAGARQVALFHHDPRRSDDAVDAIVARLQGRGVVVVGARRELKVRLAGGGAAESP